jgi:hypothetical protein
VTYAFASQSDWSPGEALVGELPPRRRWHWLCVYCHTVQKYDRDACANCNAPRPDPTPEAQPTPEPQVVGMTISTATCWRCSCCETLNALGINECGYCGARKVHFTEQQWQAIRDLVAAHIRR